MTKQRTPEQRTLEQHAPGRVADRGLAIPDATWHGVSNRYIVTDVVGTVVFGVIAVAVASIWLLVTGWGWAWLPPAALGAIFLLYVLFTPRRVRSIGYQLRDDDLLFKRGIMFRRIVAVPYGRMQLVDINRGPIDRALGLAELKFITAAAGTQVTVPGLPIAEAERLRDELVRLAESRRTGL